MSYSRMDLILYTARKWEERICGMAWVAPEEALKELPFGWRPKISDDAKVFWDGFMAAPSKNYAAMTKLPWHLVSFDWVDLYYPTTGEDLPVHGLPGGPKTIDEQVRLALAELDILRKLYSQEQEAALICMKLEREVYYG